MKPPLRRAMRGLTSAGLLLAGMPFALGQDSPTPLTATNAPANGTWADSLNLTNVVQGYGQPGAGHSVDSNPLTLAGVVYPHGIGTHAEATLLFDLKGVATRFQAMAGVDDERKGSGSVTFTLLVDGKKATETGVLHGGDAPVPLSVDLTGAKRLEIEIGDGGDGINDDHADLGGALFTLVPGATQKPVTLPVPPIAEVPARLVMLPPDPKPAIHGPRRVGTTPGRPFLFLIPATGQAPLRYEAKGLPAGLTLDPATGIISGTLAQAGATAVPITVSGPKGTTHRTLTIVGGPHMLALTPPMGWNSWNVWAGKVDADKVKAAADEMMATGLAGHGFGYINIDDTWEAGRDAQGRIQANEKFPDMKALADYVHGKGLKIGIYSSPGPKTCGGYEASYQHEVQDAQSYADWGFDYLKYDWCSYDGVVHGDHSLPALQKPYAVMRSALDATGRDIVFSLCQYGMGDVWTWGAAPSIGGNCWRSTGDIQDNWSSLHGIYESQAGHEKYAGPGHWNDPDMLMVGVVGFGNTHPTHLKPNEQVLHISMWCLLSAPLLIGCDMTRLDPLTVALLSNDEALDINQDPLGKPAARVVHDGDTDVWARPLFDGTDAVGLTNAGSTPTVITVNWSDIGLSGKQPVRDLWLHKNVGSPSGKYSVEVPAHGAVLLKIGTPAKDSE
jgi:alpha-galactosidase